MDAPEVTTEELAAALTAGAVVVDVRTQEEWDDGHVPGIRHIPLDELADRWEDELPDDGPIYIMCHTDGRSRAAASALVASGRGRRGRGGWHGQMDRGRSPNRVNTSVLELVDRRRDH